MLHAARRRALTTDCAAGVQMLCVREVKSP